MGHLGAVEHLGAVLGRLGVVLGRYVTILGRRRGKAWKWPEVAVAELGTGPRSWGPRAGAGEG